MVSLRVDVWGRNWYGTDHNDGWWNWEDADTDMGNLTTAQLEDYHGPTFPSRDHWLLAARESKQLLARWFRQDRRRHNGLRWSWW